MAKANLSRRNILRGAAFGSAVSIGLPLFDQMFNDSGTAMADGGPIPLRFGIFFWGNGVIPERWTPSETGASWELTEQLEPLREVKDYLNIVTGTNIKVPNTRGHQIGCVGVLSGAPMIPQDPGGAGFASTFSAPTIDQVVADHIGSDTRFRSLEYGIYSNVSTSEGTTLRYLSHNGPDDINPPEYDPRALFNKVFGDEFRAPDEAAPEVDPRVGLRRSVLDAVMADANDLRAKLGTNDQVRLDRHLEGIRQLEMQLMRLEENEPMPYLDSCARPGVPEDPQDGRDQRPRNQVMSGILAMALACDQTRVFSNLFSGSVGSTRFPDTSSGHHSLTHNEGDPWAEVHRATVYIMECLKDTLVALRDVPEGDGNILDHTAILASTDLSWDHSPRDFPIILAGGACGALRNPGIHYRSMGANTSDAILTVGRAAPPELSEIGREDGHSTSTISELEGA